MTLIVIGGSPSPTLADLKASVAAKGYDSTQATALLATHPEASK